MGGTLQALPAAPPVRPAPLFSWCLLRPAAGENDASCQKFFSGIQGPLSACKTVLATLTVAKDSECPWQCHGVFNVSLRARVCSPLVPVQCQLLWLSMEAQAHSQLSCPSICLQDLPPECAMFVNRTLPQSYRGPPAAGNGSQPL